MFTYFRRMRRLPPAMISGYSPIQRHEKPVPKLFYAPEWELSKSGKRQNKDGKEGAYSPMKNFGVTPDKWEYLNKVIWPPNYVVPETGKQKPMEVFHCKESIHLQPKKIFTACHFALNMVVDDAIKQLRAQQNKPTLTLADVIEEAKERAQNEFYVEKPGNNMFVAEAFAIQSSIVKGLRRHAKERWHVLRYRYINLHVRLQTGQPPLFKGREPDPNGWDKLNDYYDYLRSRDFKYAI